MRIIGFVSVACILVLGGCVSQRADDDVPEIDLPTRIAASAPSAVEIPEVPNEANDIVPVTFRLRSTLAVPGRPRRVTTQLVTRSASRVRLVLDGGRREWLFERNPVDARRVSGWLIDHYSREILVHQETDLRSEQQVRGWADVLMMRFDPVQLRTLRPTGEAKQVDGLVFNRHVASDRTARGVVDVWWSEAGLLPLLMTVRGSLGTTTSTIEAMDRRVDLACLADPRTRFPGYEVIDVVDARDRRH